MPGTDYLLCLRLAFADGASPTNSGDSLQETVVLAARLLACPGMYALTFVQLK